MCATGQVAQPLLVEHLCRYWDRSLSTPRVVPADQAPPTLKPTFQAVELVGISTDYIVYAGQQSCAPVTCTVPVIQGVRVKFPTYTVSAVGASNSLGLDLVNCTGRSFGSTCAPVCKVGYRPNPEEKLLQCTQAGYFTGELSCMIKSCPDAPVLPSSFNGMLANCNGKVHLEVCEVTCPFGYNKAPDSDFICSDGVFPPLLKAPCSEKNCTQPLVLVNMGQTNCSGNLLNVLPGETCNFTCATGYKADGDYVCSLGSLKQRGAGCVPEQANVESTPALPFELSMAAISAAPAQQSSPRSQATSSYRTAALVFGTSAEELGKQLAVELNSKSLPVNSIVFNTYDAAQASYEAEAARFQKAVRAAVSSGGALNSTPSSWNKELAGIALGRGASAADIINGFATALSNTRASASATLNTMAGAFQASSPFTVLSQPVLYSATQHI